MKFGFAKSIAIKTIVTNQIDNATNEWLECNADVEVLEIKPSIISGMPAITIVYRKGD